MRVIFLGSGEFAVPSFRAILASSHKLVGVITQPARPAGRGGKMRPTPLAEAARDAGLKAIECLDVNAPSAVEMIAGAGGDVIAVADFGQLIRKAARQAPPHGAFNLHGSLLPALRGAAPVNWAIIRGLTTTGVTTFRLVGEMDAGDIYLQASTEIGPSQTAGELKASLAELGAPLVVRTLDMLEAGGIKLVKQDESAATFAPVMQKSDGRIDWTADARTIRNLIHGCWPWPGGQAVFCHADGRPVPLVVARAEAIEGQAVGEPGIVDADGAISCGQGRLRILELQPAGKRLMTWRDFVNGYRVVSGDYFSSPPSPDEPGLPRRPAAKPGA